MRKLAMTVALALVFLASSLGHAQEAVNSLKTGTKALSFALPGGGGALVGARYFLKDSMAVGLDVGLSMTSTKPASGDRQNSAGISVSPSVRWYLFNDKKIAPYYKLAANLTKLPGVSVEDGTTLDLGGMFGVEYFFVTEFSVGGEIGLAVNIRNKFKDFAAQTGTGALFANFHF